MTMDSKRVEHLAELIRLEISADETANLRSDLKEITAYMTKLRNIEQESPDFPDDETTEHIQPLREDRIQALIDVEEALKNAPGTENKLFKVPRVIKS